MFATGIDAGAGTGIDVGGVLGTFGTSTTRSDDAKRGAGGGAIGWATDLVTLEVGVVGPTASGVGSGVAVTQSARNATASFSGGLMSGWFDDRSNLDQPFLGSIPLSSTPKVPGDRPRMHPTRWSTAPEVADRLVA